MTNTKIKLTERQAKFIERALESGMDKEEVLNKFAHRIAFSKSHRHHSLTGLCVMDLARALLIGYEVEPEFKAGDWVVRTKDGGLSYRRVGRYFQVERLSSGGREVIDGDGWGHSFECIRHAKPEEIAQEKERRKWVEIGRKVGEIKEGDIGEVNTGKLIFSKSEIEAAYSHGALKGLFPIEKFVDFWGDDHE